MPLPFVSTGEEGGKLQIHGDKNKMDFIVGGRSGRGFMHRIVGQRGTMDGEEIERENWRRKQCML